MKSSIVVLVLILGLISCTQTKYMVKPESDLSKVDWINNTFNYIPLMDSDLKKSTILDKTYWLIAEKKYSKLNKFLSSIQLDSPDLYLAKTLYHISKSEYFEAENNLKMITGNNYLLIKELLFIDLNYELAKSSGSKDYKNFLYEYQILMDKNPDNELLKKIIILRTRYIRYNY